ncbi:hypothetical protein [Streptomyces odonnellii]|uniref:hypothetical protein n=1 Tax=Streptomyces odonnellii TaxID=1417980 RepID=UPI000A45904D|nr:hypothetical protein [Streptomyces odonnellii]
MVENGPGGYHYLGPVKAFARRQALTSLGREQRRQALQCLLRHYLADGSADTSDVRAVRAPTARCSSSSPWTPVK